MINIKLAIRDFLDNLSGLIILFLQIFISIFCVTLVLNQYQSDRKNYNAIKNAQAYNIVTFNSLNSSSPTHTNNITSNLNTIIRNYPSFTLYTDETIPGLNAYRLFGNLPQLVSTQFINQDNLLITSAHTNTLIINEAKSKHRIKDENIIFMDSILLPQKGSIDLKNTFLIKANEYLETEIFDYRTIEELIHNLTFYNISNEQISEISHLLSDDYNRFYPNFLNDNEFALLMNTNNRLLLNFFIIVSIFVCINIFISLRNILNKKKREYYINRMFGLTKKDTSVRLFIFMLLFSFIPCLISIFISTLFLGLNDSLFIEILIVSVLNIVLFLLFRNTLLKDDISSEMRSDYDKSY